MRRTRPVEENGKEGAGEGEEGGIRNGAELSVYSPRGGTHTDARKPLETGRGGRTKEEEEREREREKKSKYCQLI